LLDMPGPALFVIFVLALSSCLHEFVDMGKRSDSITPADGSVSHDWAKILAGKIRRKDSAEADPNGLEPVSFWESLCDMYAPPHTVRLRRPASGRAGAEQDARNIRGYFNKALWRIR